MANTASVQTEIKTLALQCLFLSNKRDDFDNMDAKTILISVLFYKLRIRYVILIYLFI